MKKVEVSSSDLVVSLLRGQTLADVERYGQWDSRRGGKYLVPSLLSTSDYTGGGLVPAANIRKWQEDFKDGDDVWWKTVTGGHGTNAVLISLDEVPEDVEDEVADFLNGLQEYPLADEDLHSDLEMKAQTEAWENHVQKEFTRALEKKFSSDLDDADNDKIFELFNEACEASSTYWENEQGDSMSIDVDRIVKKVTKADMTTFDLPVGNA